MSPRSKSSGFANSARCLSTVTDGAFSDKNFTNVSTTNDVCPLVEASMIWSVDTGVLYKETEGLDEGILPKTQITYYERIWQFRLEYAIIQSMSEHKNEQNTDGEEVSKAPSQDPVIRILQDYGERYALQWMEAPENRRAAMETSLKIQAQAEPESIQPLPDAGEKEAFYMRTANSSFSLAEGKTDDLLKLLKRYQDELCELTEELAAKADTLTADEKTEKEYKKAYREVDEAMLLELKERGVLTIKNTVARLRTSQEPQLTFRFILKQYLTKLHDLKGYKLVVQKS